MNNGTHNIFVSHSHADDALVGQLKQRLRAAGYNIRDGSIDSSKPNNARNPDYIWRAYLKPRITWAGKMVVLIGADTHSRYWVDREIREAHRQGMRIVGIFAAGGKEADVPEALRLYGHSLIGWSSAHHVMDVITGCENRWVVPCGDGTFRPAPPGWQLVTGGCGT